MFRISLRKKLHFRAFYALLNRPKSVTVKVYLVITGHEDVARLQMALDVITTWANEWHS